MNAVDQLLFGYRDGHTLLAGSRELTPTQLRDVLPHTDASLEEGDESELVGAWVESLPGYLLARIWPAPEAERRGAVWAHALLLSPEQLRQEGLAGLLDVLRRPENGELDGYGHPLDAPPSRALPCPPTPLARAIVWATLGAGERPGAVLWDAPAGAGEALIALLEALPAGARADVGFRTRAAAASRAAYRLQVAKSISRHAAEGMLVIDARRPPPETPPTWTMLLGDSSMGARQRDLVQRYGSDDVQTREQVRSLVTIAAMLAEEAEPGRVVQELAESFPEPTDVPDLRRALVGPLRAGDGLWEVAEEQRLELLCKHAPHFDIDELDVERRISRLAHAHPHAALRVIERLRGSRRRESLQQR